MKIGILGGTFDPIHYGHLVAAGCSAEEYNLDKIIFIPSARPPHKSDGQVADCRHRYEMTALAIQGIEAFELSDLEIKREGRSYTVDTLKALKAIYPQDELFFIMGQDAFEHFGEWKNPEEILQYATLLVVSRPGSEPDLRELFTELAPEAEDRICFIFIPGLYISSSDLRERIIDGRTVKFLLPDAVAQYIKANQVYGGLS